MSNEAGKVRRIRSIEQWRGMVPSMVVAGSVAQVQHALADARHDILMLNEDYEASERRVAEKDDKLMRLASEMNRLQSALHSQFNALMSSERRVKELEAENAELRKDAARYRWLRDEAINLDECVPMIVMVDSRGRAIADEEGFANMFDGDEADAVIDTAMAGEAESEQ